MYAGMALLFKESADADLYLSYLKAGDRSSAGTLLRINALKPVETPLSGTIVEFKPDPGPSLIRLDLDRLPQGWDRSTWEAWENCYVFNMQLALADTK